MNDNQTVLAATEGVDYRQTVLMVDDRPENLVALDAILDDGQTILLRAHSGEQALQLLLDHEVALVLLEYFEEHFHPQSDLKLLQPDFLLWFVAQLLLLKAVVNLLA